MVYERLTALQVMIGEQRLICLVGTGSLQRDLKQSCRRDAGRKTASFFLTKTFPLIFSFIPSTRIMSTETFHSRIAIVQESSLHTVRLIDDLVAYRHEVTTTTERSGDYPLNTLPSVVREGIASMAEIQAYIMRPNDEAIETVFPSHNDIPHSRFHFMRKSGREWLAKNGFFWAVRKQIEKEARKVFDDANIKLPYTAFTNGEVSLEELAYYAFESHLILDYDGNPLPTAFEFSDVVTDRSIDERAYDLKKAVQILMKRDDVQFLNESGDALKKTGNSSKICRSRSWSSHTQEYNYLHIMWSPSNQDMQAIWDYCKQVYPKKHLSRYDITPYQMAYRAIFEKDLLGLRAGGAAKFGSYEDSFCNSPRVFEEDDYSEDNF